MMMLNDYQIYRYHQHRAKTLQYQAMCRPPQPDQRTISVVRRAVAYFGRALIWLGTRLQVEVPAARRALPQPWLHQVI